MKKLLTLTTLIFTVVFLSSCDDTREIPNPSGNWKKVTETDSGDSSYLDFGTISKKDGYVYWWHLTDFLKPVVEDLSWEYYMQGDCNLFQHKVWRISSYKKHMGEGYAVIVDMPDFEWGSTSANSPIGIVQKKVCEYVPSGEWKKVAGNDDGNSFYLDFETIRKQDGYVYFWQLTDYPKPDEDGDLSDKVYLQGDCKLFRLEALSFFSYKQPMGQGDSGSVKVPGEWINPPPKTVGGLILKKVCEYLN